MRAFIELENEDEMMNTAEQDRGLSFNTAALTAGFGLLLMVMCAPPAFFYFLPQGSVEGDAAATVTALQTAGGTPYLIGAFLLFCTYCLDILVAWALYWLVRPGQPAIAQLVGWTRLVYAALAFVGLIFTFQVYDLATSAELAATLGNSALQNAVMAKLISANAATAFALFFFGFHLVTLGIAVFRSSTIPNWLGILLILAGLSYILMHIQRYAAPDLAVDWLLIFSMGELVFMIWMIFTGLRRKAE